MESITACPMGPPMMEQPSYDIEREQEFYRYFEPLSLGLAGKAPISHAGPIQIHASPDRSLTAFAQLAALRMDCRRSFISFFDRNYQYIVAEATRSLSLRTETEFEPGDGIHYGVSIVPKRGSICEHTVAAPTDSLFVIEDLREDDRFKNQDFTAAKDFVFYAGAPIASPSGRHIGAFCVIDDKPRKGLSENETALLKDMATTVMVHMDMLRAQSESVKGERMVRGLGSFVEGKSSLDDWWMSPDERDEDEAGDPNLSPRVDQRWADRQYRRHHSKVAKHDPSSPMPFGPDLFGLSSSNRRRQASYASSSDGTLGSLGEDPKAKRTSKVDTFSIEVKQTFERAARIIRESLEIDAVCCFDAKAGHTFGGLVGQNDHERPKRRELSVDSKRYSIDPGTDDSATTDVDDKSQKEDDKACEVLGISTREPNNIFGDQTAKLANGMTEGFLRSLLNRYPQGNIFSFDDSDASVTPRSSSRVNESGRKKRKRLRSKDVKLIKKMFPGVRSLAIVPLWDSHQLFFSACVAWTCDSHRILSSGEINYLAAFGDSMMAEVARINAKTADKSKGDVLSSISHELRSPLQGILGSVECLQDSTLDPFQENLVHTMETCGKTLLDTIDHLLDFTKVNNFSRKHQRRAQPSADGQTQNFALDVDVDLSVITEEVLDAVFAGHDFINAGQYGENTDKTAKSENPGPRREVSVVVDIKKAKNSHWIFRTQAGAWRRILMNLFGNSLKYTEKGFIQVTLEAEPLPEKHKKGRSKVRLIVTDSGKGISKEYLERHLFVPFAQEDSLQPGTGLGLAITSSIIRSMGGVINVKSEQGHGTEVTVELTMTHAPASQETLEQSLISNAATKLHSLKIGFLGFEANSFTSQPRPNMRSPENGYHLFMTSFHRMAQNWFGMSVHIVTGLEEADADIFLATEYGLDQLEEMKRQSEQNREEQAAITPLLVLCNSVAAANTMMHQQKSHISGIISQPCGPRKLAKALTLTLEQFKNHNDPGKAMTIRELFDENREKDNKAEDESRPQRPKEAQSNISTTTNDNIDDMDPPLKHPTKEVLSISQGQGELQQPKKPIANGSASPPQAPKVNENARNVLLVDDNRINLQLLVTFMKKSGHDFTTASNGLEALEACKAKCGSEGSTGQPKSSFDFVLMDLSMPVMDGLESTRRIRAYERSHKIKPTTVIALTGLASASAQQEAFSSGIDTFMTKPVKLKDLSKIMEGQEKPTSTN